MSQVSLPAILTTNSWAARMAGSVLDRYPASQWKWHYEHGLMVKAVAAVGDSCRELSFQGFDQAWLDHFVSSSGEICTYQPGEYNLDQINPGKLLFRVYRKTGDERYAAALRLLRLQLKNQPRNLSGGFWHKGIYPNQMWLDGLYMAGPFYAEYALTFGEASIFEDLAHQFILIEQHARDPQTGLLYHAWDESRQQAWANPETGCSPNFWGRAIGWYAMALVDSLEFIPATLPQHSTLVEIMNRLAQASTRFQDPASGLWYQVVNLPERPGNYLETSVSAMLAYSFAKAGRNGWLASEYLSAARRAYRGLLENMMRIDASGMLKLEGTCSVAGLGGSPYRDGSFEYYVREPVAANDFKGVGPFILTSLEMEKDKALERN